MLDGRNSHLANEKDRDKGPSTLETIMKRNNSITVVKKHGVPYGNLHKKTYFNALEKILMSPVKSKKTAGYNIPIEGSRTIQETAEQAFEDVFKKPPSRLGEGDMSPARMGSKRNRAGNTSTSIKVQEDKVNMGLDDSDSDNGSTSKVDVRWFDSFVDRQNISLDDQVEPAKYQPPEAEFARESAAIA